jgi:phosphogluconate dehydratase
MRTIKNRQTIVADVTQRLQTRSQETRAAYLQKIAGMRKDRAARLSHAAANQAHGYAALPSADKIAIRSAPVPMLAIVSAYNDVLSAHQPFEGYPNIIRDQARKHAAVAQFAGGVPAMCDGVTQGHAGMELSLFSRDVIAMSTAIALSHDLYDAQMLLGVCDKIVPGLLMGALSFGHLPAIFVPAGPMATGISNIEKTKVRKAHAQGQVSDAALLESEMAAYHDKGTCTFYGTANSNQFLLEAMGLMLPGAAFVQPDDARRESLTRGAVSALAQLAHEAQANTNPLTGPKHYRCLGTMVNEKSILNAIIALLATGGSTNHTMHWVAVARAAGVLLEWEDIHELAQAIPTLTRIYPSGEADVNQFDQAGGIAAVLATLVDSGLAHAQVDTVVGPSLHSYCYRLAPTTPLEYDSQRAVGSDDSIIRTVSNPFLQEGGLQLLQGNIGRAIIKTSAVNPEHLIVRAQARVFNTQEAVLLAFKNNEFTTDVVVVVKNQGPQACGMPELHKLTPALSVLLDRGLQIALVTDGRMSGASGKVPAAIHCCPEAIDGGVIGLIEAGDWIEVNCKTATLNLEVNPAELAARRAHLVATSGTTSGQTMGRDLFAHFRRQVSRADQGASVFGDSSIA